MSKNGLGYQREGKVKDLRKTVFSIGASAGLLAIMILSGCAQVSSHESENRVAPVGSAAPETSRQVSAAPVEVMPVVEMNLEHMIADFKADPVAAETEYGGKRFFFKNVTAEDMSPLHKPVTLDLWVMHGNVKFRPEYPSMVTPLRVNSVMDIEGTVLGTQDSFIIVADCRYTVTDTTNAIERPDYQSTFD